MTFAMPLRLEPVQAAVDDDGVRCVVAFPIDGQAWSQDRECRDCDDDGHRRCGPWCVTAPLAMFEFGAGAWANVDALAVRAALHAALHAAGTV
jgi:hypothetical protein